MEKNDILEDIIRNGGIANASIKSSGDVVISMKNGNEIKYTAENASVEIKALKNIKLLTE